MDHKVVVRSPSKGKKNNDKRSTLMSPIAEISNQHSRITSNMQTPALRTKKVKIDKTKKEQPQSETKKLILSPDPDRKMISPQGKMRYLAALKKSNQKQKDQKRNIRTLGTYDRRQNRNESNENNIERANRDIIESELDDETSGIFPSIDKSGNIAKLQAPLHFMSVYAPDKHV